MDKKVNVKGISINLVSQREDDYISLTDIAKYKSDEAGRTISHWMSTLNTLEFLSTWEKIYNPNFKVPEFGYFKDTDSGIFKSDPGFKPVEIDGFRNRPGNMDFSISVEQWVTKTGAIGIFAKRGRYGGTYAHKDIAFEFASWVSPEFKLYLIKEFQRLKEQENERLSLGWDLKRELAKVNYRIHTDAVKEHLIPPLLSIPSNMIYADEADVLNIALFGMTALEWRERNPEKEGSVRDHSTIEQLVVLSNLESLNAEFIREGLEQRVRLQKLNEIAIYQMKSLLSNRTVKKLK